MTSENERILFIAEVESWGGAERSFLALCSWLHKNDLPYRLVLYWDHIGLERFAQFPLKKTELLPGKTAWNKIRSLKNYFSSLPDTSPKALMSGYQPALHATLAGLRGFHCLLHDTESFFDDWDQRKSIRQWSRLAVNRQILHWGLNSGGKTIVASDFLKQDASMLYGVESVIARIGSTMNNVSQSPHRIGKNLRILSVSRVEANKRIDWILQALHNLEEQSNPLSKHVDWRLDIVGNGTQREALQALSYDLGLHARVHFHGFVNDDELALLYAQSNLFLMPARQGYGIPALEALNRGIPVVLHRDSGISDILLDTPWAKVFYGDSESLAPALSQMIQSILTGIKTFPPLPQLPAEDAWAETVARICGWI